MKQSLLLKNNINSKLAVSVTTALVAIMGNAACAQDDAQEITVTGSRIVRDGFEMASPTTVVGRDTLDDMGIVNVGDALSLLPQNSAAVSDTNVGSGNFNVGAQLANLRGLNPFFGTRTLTLLNTRRHVPTTTGGAVDMSLIPSTLVGRIETVTGGASAAYGSDAVAGVVNVLLNTDLEGFKLDVDYAETFEGEGGSPHIGFGFGSDFADGRGHIIFGGEYQDSGSVDNCTSRSWCSSNYAAFTNNLYAFNSDPNIVIGPNAQVTRTTQAGVLTDGAGFGPTSYQLNSAGDALLPYTPGDYYSGLNGFGNQQGGDEGVGPYDYRQLRASVERYSVMTHIDYELTDSVNSFLELSYAETEARSTSAQGNSADTFGGAVIWGDNYYLNQLTLPAGFDPTFGLGLAREMTNLRPGINDTENESYRVAFGLDGDFIIDGWSWDAYYQYGHNENSQVVSNRLVNDTTGAFTFTTNGGPFGFGTNDYFSWALDAVDDGSGNPVCREVLLGNPAAAGCQPLNLFGTNNASEAALDYIFRPLTEVFEYEQSVLAGTIQGTLAEGFGAGTIDVAAGLEYRTEEGSAKHGNDIYYLQQPSNYGGDYAGELEVIEGFVEVDIPVLRDLPFAEVLAFNAAVRQTSNKTTADANNPNPNTAGRSSTVDITNWKVSGIYDPFEWMRFRGTVSRDARAAAFRELYFDYSGVGAQQTTVINPWTGDPADATLRALGGNFQLKPEEADTKSLGVVFSPSGAVDGLRVSLDWYEIELNDAIATFGVGAATIVGNCFADSSSSSCASIQGTSNGSGGFTDIVNIDDLATNLGSVTTRGWDLEASYVFPVESLGGDISMRVVTSYLYDMIIEPGNGAPIVNYHGQSGPAGLFGDFSASPDWQASAWLGYTNGKFSSTLQAQYVGSGQYATFGGGFSGLAPLPIVGPDSPDYDASAANSVSDNTVDSNLVFTLSASYLINMENESTVELFGVINNIFDEDPPIAPGGNGFPTNPTYFDTLGARFRVGARMQF